MEFEKTAETKKITPPILERINIPMSQTHSLEMTHLDKIKTTTTWYLELENIKGLWKKLIEFEKIAKY